MKQYLATMRSDFRAFRGRRIGFAGVSLFVLAALAAGTGTEDSTLSTTITSVTTYFTANIGYVVAAVVSLTLIFWMIHILWRSVGLGRSKNKVG